MGNEKNRIIKYRSIFNFFVIEVKINQEYQTAM